LPGAAYLKFLLTSGESVQELQMEKRHQKSSTLLVPRLSEVRERCVLGRSTNFGKRALAHSGLAASLPGRFWSYRARRANRRPWRSKFLMTEFLSTEFDHEFESELKHPRMIPGRKLRIW